MNDNPFNLNDTLCHAQIGLLNFEIPNISLINPVICEYVNELMKSVGWRLKSMNSIAMCAKLLDLHTNFSSSIIVKYTGCLNKIFLIVLKNNTPIMSCVFYSVY